MHTLASTREPYSNNRPDAFLAFQIYFSPKVYYTMFYD